MPRTFSSEAPAEGRRATFAQLRPPVSRPLPTSSPASSLLYSYLKLSSYRLQVRGERRAANRTPIIMPVAGWYSGLRANHSCCRCWTDRPTNTGHLSTSTFHLSGEHLLARRDPEASCQPIGILFLNAYGHLYIRDQFSLFKV